MKYPIKIVEYQTATKDGKPWSRWITSKKKAIQIRNSTWPQIDVIKVTTTFKLVSPGKVS